MSSDKNSKEDLRNKNEERLNRLHSLRMRQNEARKLNHQEVVEEDRKSKLPANWEKRQERMQLEEDLEKKKLEAEANGLSYDRLKVLEWGAEECDLWDKRKMKKTNPDTGFADYEQSSARTSERLSKQIEPDMDNYERQKAELGEDFYATTQTLTYGTHKPSATAVDKMVQDLDKQVMKRKSYSRKRVEKPDADIDYINKRNMRFNKRIERFYGKYTTEIKQNLERGTAV